MTDIGKALAILRTHSPYFDPWAMSGGRNAKARADVMSLLCGTKQTQAQSGVTAIRARLIELSGATGGCIAERKAKIEQWAKAMG
jgi:hypothetical protein